MWNWCQATDDAERADGRVTEWTTDEEKKKRKKTAYTANGNYIRGM